VEEGGTLTATVSAEVHNGGADPAENVLVQFERDGLPAGQVALPAIAGGGSQWATVSWPGLAPGFYQVIVTIDPGAVIVECNQGNNQKSVRLGFVEHRIYLPLIWRDG
jgi:subtilase family serine protease